MFWSLDSSLAYKRHFPAINWLTSYSLYIDSMADWFNANVHDDWMSSRGQMMRLLQDEAELQEIVQLVGMDALSAPDRLKLEAARSLREDFLHQNSFHEIDTYTPLEKQYLLMKLVLAYYNDSVKALNRGADVEQLVKLPVRERIGRFKYTAPENIDAEYESVLNDLTTELSKTLKEAM